MRENTQNSFEGYIDLFTFYIILINYAIFMDQILIFDSIESKTQLSLFFFPTASNEPLIKIPDKEASLVVDYSRA